MGATPRALVGAATVSVGMTICHPNCRPPHRRCLLV